MSQPQDEKGGLADPKPSLPRNRVAGQFNKPIPTGHDLDCRCVPCRNFLGTCLEWIVGSALQRLKVLGLVQAVEREALPEESTKERRVADYPDWWVLLFNGTEIEIECKAWTARWKKYTKKPTDTEFWAYDYETVKAGLKKNWLPHSWRLLAITTLELLTKGYEGGRTAVREKVDDVYETWGLGLRDPDDEYAIQEIAKGLREKFEKAKKR